MKVVAAVFSMICFFLLILVAGFNVYLLITLADQFLATGFDETKQIATKLGFIIYNKAYIIILYICGQALLRLAE